MENKPFTFSEATKICNHFQRLVGLEMLSDGGLPISYVVVSPYDEVNIRIFLDKLRDTQNSDEAIASYPGPFYDVLLLYSGEEDIIYRNIRSYTQEMGYDYEPPISS